MSSQRVNDILWRLREVGTEKHSSSRTVEIWAALETVAGTPEWDVPFDYAVAHEMFSEDTLVRLELQHQAAVARQPWKNPADEAEMIWIEPGLTHIDGNDEPLTIGGFSMARHPITNDQFYKFMLDTSYEPNDPYMNNDYFLRHWLRGTNMSTPFGEPRQMDLKRPVTWVAWLDALEYCRWAGLVLPTTWMWQKAAGGPEGRPFPWGDHTPSVHRYYQADAISPESGCDLAQLGTTGLADIGTFPRTRTAYGCQDMVGNVAEMCQHLDDTPRGLLERWPDLNNPTSIKGRALGANFQTSDASKLRISSYRTVNITRREPWLGFRPAFAPVFSG